MRHYISAFIVIVTLGVLLVDTAEVEARTSWNNFRFYKSDKKVYVQFIQRGDRWLEYQNNQHMHSFKENKRTHEWVELYDASRQLFVRLWNDRCDVWIVKRHPRWVSYYRGGWHSNRFHVTFERMFIHDDKEGGKGDWNLRASITGTITRKVLLGKKEAGTGQAILIKHTFIVRRSKFDVFCQVREYDGGFDAEWEYVGERRLPISTSGKYQIRIRGNEGDVSIYLNVIAVD